jgi:hypothetical protein
LTLDVLHTSVDSRHLVAGGACIPTTPIGTRQGVPATLTNKETSLQHGLVTKPTKRGG